MHRLRAELLTCNHPVIPSVTRVDQIGHDAPGNAGLTSWLLTLAAELWEGWVFALGLLACLPFVCQFGASFVCIPANSAVPLKPSWRWHAVGLIAYWLATILAVLRLPFALLPYLAKLLLHALCGFGYKTARNGYLLEALGMLGDISNWVLVSSLVALLVGPPRPTIIG